MGKFNLKKHSDASTKGEDIEIRWARKERIRTLAELSLQVELRDSLQSICRRSF